MWSVEHSCEISWLSAVAYVLVALIAIKLYMHYTTGICTSKRKMSGKTVIITGANAGIGCETALDIARRGARVIMACRNMELSNKVRDKIVRETKNDNVVVRKLDLSSFQSVREFASKINETEARLDVLIHNAGIANVFSKKTNEDGLELTMATNQYGPFLLTHLLIDLLKRSAPSRIVVVASEHYRLGNINLNNPNPVNCPLPAYLYYVSKYANILFTRELSKRLEGTGVTANCLHPGVIDTGIWRNVPFPLSLPLKVLLYLLKNIEQGAQTTIHVAVSEEVEGVNGKYFMDCKVHGLTRGVQDMAKAKRYWEICESVVQLTSNDPRI